MTPGQEEAAKRAATGQEQPAFRYIENETGLEVALTTMFVWGNEAERLHAVKYPSGRVFVINDHLRALHFTIVTPQELLITAFGVDDRPLRSQLLKEQAGG